IAGSGGEKGIVRNLDKANTAPGSGNQEGLNQGVAGVNYQTFPLGDSSPGTELINSCAYPAIDDPGVIPTDSCYLAHVSEGIEASSRNEFLCFASNFASEGASEAGLLGLHTTIVHGVALQAAD